MIKLTPFTVADFPRLIQWINSPELLVQWSGPVMFTYPLNVTQLQTYLEMGRGDAPEALIYTVRDEEDAPVGHIELGVINRPNGTASVCRVFVSPTARGRGLCVPMLQALLRVGFDELCLRRIDLRVYTFNTPAIACYERVGFVHEGMLRQCLRVGEQIWDMALMGMLREEWEAHKA